MGSGKSKLATRFNRVNFLLIILIMIVTIVVSGTMILNLTDTASRDYVRFFTMETVDILSLHLTKEIWLIHQAANTPEVAEWFADEGNPEKKAAAFHMMLPYTDILQVNSLHFAIAGSNNEYAIEHDTSLDDFVPFYVLERSNNNDIWFFDAINTAAEFTLNLDMCKMTNTRRLWINYTVTKDGHVVGVFCSALQFDVIFNDMFGQYDNINVKGFLTDHRGIIQMDSSDPEPILRNEDNTVIVNEVSILSIDSNQEINDAITRHQRDPSVFMGMRTEPEIIRLSGRDFQYLSIAPIPNTNWLAVTFFNSGTLFNAMDVLPPILAVIFAFAVFAVINYMLIKRLALRPLNMLTESVSHSGEGEIYGVDRNDEIGDLARTARDTYSDLRNINTDLYESNERTKQMSLSLQDTALELEKRTHELELQTATLTTLFDSIPDIVFAKDLDMRFTHCNKAFMAHFGCGDEIIGKTDAEGFIISAERVEKYNKLDRKIILSRRTNIEEECAPSVSGSMESFETIKTPLMLDNNPIGILGIARNITKRKEMEQKALEASRSKSEFLANMSHEIRTPMNSIVGFSELALGNDNPPKTKEYLEMIIQNADWLLQIINDILDISKIESGKFELESIPFDLREIFASCRTIIMPKVLEKGLMIHFYAEPSIGKVTYGDPTRLRQVLINLLSNAVKFTNSGMIKLQSTMNHVGDDFITMLFEVKDSGIGMTAEQLETIFDPFIQADADTTRKYGGTGLGLAITRNIVEMMGGKLTAESMPGVGSKFSFEITFTAIDSDKDGVSAKRVIYEDLEKPTFDGEVLLCEDNTMNQQVICEHLTRVGIKTVVANNGEEGLRLVKNRIKEGEKQFDLVFMDIHMPVMDGLETTAKILELDASIPIVALTANVMSHDHDVYKTIGIRDCVGKPFTSQELWRCLMVYFEPVTWQREDINQRKQADNELKQKLIDNFVKNNQEKYKEINDALNEGDIKLAHRLVHTLKSTAGSLDKVLLQQAAAEVESCLAGGENHVTPQQLKMLKTELVAALAELTPFVSKPRPSADSLEMLSIEASRELLGKLEPLLIKGSTECLKMIETLRTVPGSEELIRQIEDFDFKLAHGTLKKLLGELK